MFDIKEMIIAIPGAMLALSMHEFGKAYVSDKLGDPTPKNEGKLTISPIAHLDPIGLLMILIAGIGWSKPINIKPNYYKNIRKGLLAVFSAGSIANILTAAFIMIIIRVLFSFNLEGFLPIEFLGYVYQILIRAIFINIFIGLFMLLPIPNLDGFYFFVNLLPKKQAEFLYKLQPYGFIILIILIFTDIIQYILQIPAIFLLKILDSIIYLGSNQNFFSIIQYF